MPRNRLILHLASIALAVGAVTCALAGVSSVVITTLLGLPLALLLPGYALSSALLQQRMFGFAEQLELSVGLSLALAVVGGFALNWTPLGLRPGSWAVLLASITVVGSTIALLRRRRRPETDGQPLRLSITPRQGLLLAAALVVVASAFAVARAGAIQQQDAQHFTQLWLLPSGATAGEPGVRVGISNQEQTDMTYAASLTEDGRPVKTWSSLSLHSGATWEVTLTLPSVGPPGQHRVDVYLYRAPGSRTVYRHVLLWLDPQQRA